MKQLDRFLLRRVEGSFLLGRLKPADQLGYFRITKIEEGIITIDRVVKFYKANKKYSYDSLSGGVIESTECYILEDFVESFRYVGDLISQNKQQIPVQVTRKQRTDPEEYVDLISEATNIGFEPPVYDIALSIPKNIADTLVPNKIYFLSSVSHISTNRYATILTFVSNVIHNGRQHSVFKVSDCGKIIEGKYSTQFQSCDQDPLKVFTFREVCLYPTPISNCTSDIELLINYPTCRYRVDYHLVTLEFDKKNLVFSYEGYEIDFGQTKDTFSIIENKKEPEPTKEEYVDGNVTFDMNSDIVGSYTCLKYDNEETECFFVKEKYYTAQLMDYNKPSRLVLRCLGRNTNTKTLYFEITSVCDLDKLGRLQLNVVGNWSNSIGNFFSVSGTSLEGIKKYSSAMIISRLDETTMIESSNRMNVVLDLCKFTSDCLSETEPPKEVVQKTEFVLDMDSPLGSSYGDKFGDGCKLFLVNVLSKNGSGLLVKLKSYNHITPGFSNQLTVEKISTGVLIVRSVTEIFFQETEQHFWDVPVGIYDIYKYINSENLVCVGRKKISLNK